MQHEAEHRVEGLTTAASIWVAAGLGIACGAGFVELAMIAVAATLIVLVAGQLARRPASGGGPTRDRVPVASKDPPPR
jgi:putative Mg2+ transporter-C (MgtC) family protein